MVVGHQHGRVYHSQHLHRWHDCGNRHVRLPGIRRGRPEDMRACHMDKRECRDVLRQAHHRWPRACRLSGAHRVDAARCGQGWRCRRAVQLNRRRGRGPTRRRNAGHDRHRLLLRCAHDDRLRHAGVRLLARRRREHRRNVMDRHRRRRRDVDAERHDHGGDSGAVLRAADTGHPAANPQHLRRHRVRHMVRLRAPLAALLPRLRNRRRGTRGSTRRARMADGATLPRNAVRHRDRRREPGNARR